MTIPHWAAAAAILAATAGTAGAQGFEGAEVSAEILAYAEDTDFGETQYRGSLELGLGAGIGIQGDLSWHGFRGLDVDGRNMTLHANYDGLAFGTVGAFAARDSLEGVDTDLFGVEAATGAAGVMLEGAFGFANSDGDDGTLLLADASYDIMGIGATASFGRFSGDIDAMRVGIGAQYALMVGPTLYGEVGRLTVDDESETYLSLGARIGIGPQNGTTFGSRSIFSVVPGF